MNEHLFHPDAQASHKVGPFLTSHRAPGCISTLTIAVFPLAIYVCEMPGKASGVAATLAGVLLVLKALIKWR